MIPRLSSPAARSLLALLALIFGGGLSDSRRVGDEVGNTRQGRGSHFIGDSVVSTSWTKDLRGTRQGTPIELPGNSGKDVRVLHLCVPGPGAKFGVKRGGSVWTDDMLMVSQSGEHTGR